MTVPTNSACLGRRLATLPHCPQLLWSSSFRQHLSTGLNQGTRSQQRTPITDATKLASRERSNSLASKRNKKAGLNKRFSKQSYKKAKSSVASHPDGVPIIVRGGSAGSENKNDLSSLSRASPFYHAGRPRSGGGSYRFTQVFPTVNFSALLNPKSYIKKSATPGGTVTISGADGARRLLRGRQALLDVMREELLDKPRNKRNPPSPYALIGHGIPQQLLQDHINMADSLLKYHNFAAECSFTNFHGDLSFNWVRIRSRNGENRACQWPPSASATKHPEWEAQMELYMTVMNRLASNLGMVLQREPAPPMVAPVDDDQDDDFVTCVESLAANTPRYWSVELLRGVAYPPHLLPKNAEVGPLAPIVEWTPRKGISAPGHVCIRLQGTADNIGRETGSLRRKKKIPVTLVFDACFRNNIRVR